MRLVLHTKRQRTRLARDCTLCMASAPECVPRWRAEPGTGRSIAAARHRGWGTGRRIALYGATQFAGTLGRPAGAQPAGKLLACSGHLASASACADGAPWAGLGLRCAGRSEEAWTATRVRDIARGPKRPAGGNQPTRRCELRRGASAEPQLASKQQYDVKPASRRVTHCRAARDLSDAPGARANSSSRRRGGGGRRGIARSTCSARPAAPALQRPPGPATPGTEKSAAQS